MKYYKILTKDLKAPSNTKYSYGGWENKTFRVSRELKMCFNGLHLYKSLENVSIGRFGERVFECEVIGEFLEDDSKICCREVRIVKELSPNVVRDSEWAYWYCIDVKDRKDVWKNIKDSYFSYMYCRFIKDRKDVWKNIKDSECAYWYCIDVKDHEEDCGRKRKIS